MHWFNHLQWWSNPSIHLLHKLQCFVWGLLNVILHHEQLIAPSWIFVIPASLQSQIVAETIELNRAKDKRLKNTWRAISLFSRSDGMKMEWIKITVMNSMNQPHICWGCQGYWKPFILLHESSSPFSLVEGFTRLFEQEHLRNPHDCWSDVDMSGNRPAHGRVNTVTAKTLC